MVPGTKVLALFPMTMLVGLGFACVTASLGVGAGDQRQVDLQLILAVDVSRSMDSEEHRLQREGYVAAFRHPEVLAAIESGSLGRIAVVYFEWAGPRYQSVAVPWTVLDDAIDLEAFANDLAAQPILPEAGTSISGALMFAERIFAVSGTQSRRRTIDISGDGPNNDGPDLEPVRQRLIASGITINGLPIELGHAGPGELTDYYRRSVVGGPASFAISVGDKSQFAAAILRKLILEVAGLPTSRTPVTYVLAQQDR